MQRLKWLVVILSPTLFAAPVFGWGRGHGLIRTWAVARLPDWQRKLLGQEHRDRLCKNYTSLQDAFAGGKRPDLKPYCIVPGVRLSLHDVNATLPSVRGMQWYLERIEEELRLGKTDEAMKFLGVLCHWNEDPGCPSAHSSPVSETVLRQLLPPPTGKQNLNYLFGYGGIADVGSYTIAEEKYQPRLLGATIPEAAARIYQHQRLLKRQAAADIVPLVQDMIHGDGKKAEQVRARAALRNGKHTADVIYTALCLATKRVDPAEARALASQPLSDWLPDFNGRLISHPYYVVPFLVNQGMDARRNLHPLRFNGNNSKVDFGLGMGTPFALKYEVAPGNVFGRFRCRAGLHPTAGPKGSIVFGISVNGKKVFTSDAVASGQPPIDIDVHLPDAELLTIELITGAGADSEATHNLAVWGEPTLYRRK